MMKRRMWSLAFGLVCAGMTLSVSGHAGWAPQKPQQIASMSALDHAALKKPITKRFVNAKLSEVLAWLSLEKLSFVADVSEFPDQGQVTLNFVQQPLGAVLDSIADAYHGRWERRGDIFTLRASTYSYGAFDRVATTGSAPAIQGMRTPGGLSAPATTGPAGGALMPGTRMRQTVEGALAAPVQGVPLHPTTPLLRGELAKTLGPTAGALAAPGTPLFPSKVQGTLSAPTIAETAKVYGTARALLPSDATGVYGTAQDAKSQDEAMRQAEKALKEAEAAIRKMHESGEWQRAMEKAMQESRGASDEHRKAMEEARRAMREMHNSKEWKDAWAKAREEIAKALKSGKVTENGKERKMTDKERQHLQDALKKFEKMPEIKFDEKFMKDLDHKVFVAPKFDEKMLEKMKLDEKTFMVPKMDMKMFEELKELQGKDGKAWVMPKMDPKAFEELRQLRSKDGKTWVMPKMDPKAFEELKKLRGKEGVWVMPEQDKKALEKMMKEHKNFTFTMPKIDGKNFNFTMPKMDGRAFTFTVPDRMSDADRETKIRQRIQEMRRRSGVGGNDAPMFRFEGDRVRGVEGTRPMVINSNRTRIKELLESLTDEQREKQEKQGYLTLDDLTPKQRTMLGDLPKEGNWTFSYSIDGKRVTIKGK